MPAPENPVAAVTPRAQTGPILSYDVPQQVNYSFQNYIEIGLDESYFLAQSVVAPQEERS